MDQRHKFYCKLNQIIIQIYTFIHWIHSFLLQSFWNVVLRFSIRFTTLWVFALINNFFLLSQLSISYGSWCRFSTICEWNSMFLHPKSKIQLWFYLFEWLLFSELLPSLLELHIKNVVNESQEWNCIFCTKQHQPDWSKCIFWANEWMKYLTICLLSIIFISQPRWLITLEKCQPVPSFW